jgi:branched-chain amino acid transport system substrate-binding protein
VRHYLKAIAACGTDEALPVMAQMRAMPVEDFFARNGRLRLDGSMVHEMYLSQAKTPAEAKSEWDLQNTLQAIPGEQAFKPLAETSCSLI